MQHSGIILEDIIKEKQLQIGEGITMHGFKGSETMQHQTIKDGHQQSTMDG